MTPSFLRPVLVIAEAGRVIAWAVASRMSYDPGTVEILARGIAWGDNLDLAAFLHSRERGNAELRSQWPDADCARIRMPDEMAGLEFAEFEAIRRARQWQS